MYNNQMVINTYVNHLAAPILTYADIQINSPPPLNTLSVYNVMFSCRAGEVAELIVEYYIDTPLPTVISEFLNRPNDEYGITEKYVRPSGVGYDILRIKYILPRNTNMVEVTPTTSERIMRFFKSKK
jgi:hypothetical protein